MNHDLYLYLLVMSAVTIAIRIVPLTGGEGAVYQPICNIVVTGVRGKGEGGFARSICHTNIAHNLSAFACVN